MNSRLIFGGFDTSHECISNLTDTAPIAFVNEYWVND